MTMVNTPVMSAVRVTAKSSRRLTWKPRQEKNFSNQ